MTNDKYKGYTPMMRQYLSVKDENPDAILFFRLGDFYEMFFDDAIIASRELDIALTKRGAGLDDKAPMCGVPFHVANQYISKLIKKGYKVAICDQVEDPKLAKGIVKREVTKILSPGTFSDIEFLDEQSNNYLVSIYVNNYYVNVAYIDYSTGELLVTDKTFYSKEEMYKFLINELEKIRPSEVLLPTFLLENKIFEKFIKARLNSFINKVDEKYIENINIADLDNYISETLKNQLKNFKEINQELNLSSIYVLLDYLKLTQKNKLIHINKIERYSIDEYLFLDESTKSNLELIKGFNTGKKKGSLLEVLDKTNTSMGSRMLKKWLEEPLVSTERINKRLDMITEFLDDLIFLEDISQLLRLVYDIERLSVKISNDSINPKEIISLKESLIAIGNIKNKLSESNKESLRKYSNKIDEIPELITLIDNMIIEDPSLKFMEERIIKEGYHKELDQLFDLKSKGQNWILDLENKEREKTGIKNLKIKYNKILGYFIEVTKSNLEQVPSDYIRKQTLVGSERYFSMDLKDMESEILGSKEKALSLQYKLFNELRDYIKNKIKEIQETANIISKLDVIVSLAIVARNNNYCRPSINTKNIINIREGRHPIVEYNISNELFVPNDTKLDMDENMVHLITGPNMAGKSTYMRQVALITIMAHIGSYVPANAADISIIDRVFTRIGASDNLAQGESTFMVEMKEVANIISFATSKSLLILDEVGRGTSTYDGLSIAWSLLEYILNIIKAKTLFATHYHELTELEKSFNSLNNLTIKIEEEGDEIVFLRKIIPGFTNNSYGIEVAKLAGINSIITDRANEILSNIEKTQNTSKKSVKKLSNSTIGQKTLFEVKQDNFVRDLSEININNLTPMESLNLLDRIIEDAKNLKDV